MCVVHEEMNEAKPANSFINTHKVYGEKQENEGVLHVPSSLHLNYPHIMSSAGVS